MPSAAILGMGVVGSGVARLLTQNASVIEKRCARALCLKYAVDIRTPSLPEGVALLTDIAPILSDPDVTIVAETIGGARVAYDYTRRLLEAGKNVVTSNKELVATHGEELLALAREHGVVYRYEAAVGGGIPLLSPIRDDLAANHITSISGIVNGSTNYLLTRMVEDSVSFPAALGEARRLGYVEADPAADIDGHDARRKLAILAHEAFGAPLLGEDTIPTVGISHLTPAHMQAAALFGGAVKLIAHGEWTGDTWQGWVHPAFVPASSPLYGVRDVFNAVLVHGDFVDDVMLYGRGAGSLPTASAVVSDMTEILSGRARPSVPSCGPAFRDRPDQPMRALLLAKDDTRRQDWEYMTGGGVTAAMTGPLPRREIDQMDGALYVL